MGGRGRCLLVIYPISLKNCIECPSPFANDFYGSIFRCILCRIQLELHGYISLMPGQHFRWWPKIPGQQTVNPLALYYDAFMKKFSLCTTNRCLLQLERLLPDQLPVQPNICLLDGLQERNILVRVNPFVRPCNCCLIKWMVNLSAKVLCLLQSSQQMQRNCTGRELRCREAALS